MMQAQADEFEKYIKDNIKIPDDIDVSFLMLEREATAIEIGVTVSIVLVIILILGLSIWACVARKALETRYPNNCQHPNCPRSELHEMAAEIRYAETIINSAEVDDGKEVFQHYEGPVWFETTDDSQGVKLTKICDEGECVTKKVMKDKLKQMGMERDGASKLRLEPKVLDGETIMILKFYFR